VKISIVTVVRNKKSTIRDAINSVLGQTYKNIEYIIVDGASTDGTIEIIQSYGDKIAEFVSEPDKGLYDAMNKGIALATGDIVGILNSDDFYIDEYVIEKVVKEFDIKKVDSVYADLVYVKPANLDKVVRYYDSSYFNPTRFAYGWMPAHPTFFVKKWAYEKYGVYRTDLKISADFDILIRFLYTHQITYSYMQEVLVKMRAGGISNAGVKSTLQIAFEQLQICKQNSIDTSIFKIMSKYPKKILELIKI
jgi:glycosyltransferase involved in cell wall biosynthesis